MKRILILGAGRVAGRNLIAALRMARDPVYVVGADTDAFHLASADTDAAYLLPDSGNPAFLETLLTIVAQERVALVHGQADAEIESLSVIRKELPGLLFLPGHEQLQTSWDRLATNRLMHAKELPAVEAVALTDDADMATLFDKVADGYGEAIIRSAMRTSRNDSVRLESGREAESWARYRSAQGGRPLSDYILATRLPGRVFEFHSLWYEGRLITSSIVERLESATLLPESERVRLGPMVSRTVRISSVNELGTLAIRALHGEKHGQYAVRIQANEAGELFVTGLSAGHFPVTVNFLAAAGSNMPLHWMQLAYGMPTGTLPVYDATEEELYWVRGMDRKPHLFKGAPWIQRRAA